MAGTKADAAIENEAETMGRISEGFSAAFMDDATTTESNRLFADSSLYFPKAIKIEVKETD